MTGGTDLISLPDAAAQEGQATLRVQKLFRWIARIILLLSLLTTCFWLFSSDRYVSEGIVIVQNTEQISAPSFDLATMLGSIGKTNSSDQLLLREHLLSVDMLNKLDAALDLRSHYSDSRCSGSAGPTTARVAVVGALGLCLTPLVQGRRHRMVPSALPLARFRRIR